MTRPFTVIGHAAIVFPTDPTMERHAINDQTNHTTRPADAPAFGSRINRRSFLAAAGAAVGGCLAPSTLATASAQKSAEPSPRPAGQQGGGHDSSVKLSERILSDVSDDYLLFLRQLGLSHVDVVLTDGRGPFDRETLERIAGRLHDEGFKLGNVNHHYFWSSADADKILLGEPGRDALIDDYIEMLEVAAAVGFQSALVGWRPSRFPYGYAAGYETTRGANTVHVDHQPEEARELVYGERYGEDRMWEHFAYWSRRVMPVAEDVGISLGVHPNPGIPEAGGIALPFHSRACYERAIEIADSPRLGLTLCVGVWATNPDLYGDPADAIRHFGEQGRLFHVHFRNISAPLPTFKETFVDNGYVDMHAVMQALYESGFDGTVIADHSPSFVNGGIAPGGVGIGHGTGTAYVVAYMRALVLALEMGWRPT